MAPDDRTESVATEIVDASVQVHRALGPGLLESAYEECLAAELWARGLACERQKTVPLRYRDRFIEAGFRLDLLVENSVIVELKAVELLLQLHEVQLYTYLKLTGLRLGLLINFNVPLVKQGIRRVICARHRP
ncbi:GxxExxY protein [Azospirillum sp. ST 5-10]|uniref:GxxExxY protein n=1 Tax=unclassified Azospirillum TaxID=2630922 RepID=UPI003F4A2B2A